MARVSDNRGYRYRRRGCARVRVHPGGLGALAGSHHPPPPERRLLRLEASVDGRPRGATPRGAAAPIIQERALPVVAPAAVGQGPMAADSLHRRLRAPRAAAEAARGWKLARCGPGAGGGLYHSPRGEPPPALPMARTHRLRGPGPEGFPPPGGVPRGRGSCSLHCLFIYF